MAGESVKKVSGGRVFFGVLFGLFLLGILAVTREVWFPRKGHVMAWRHHCASNLKQIALGIAQYYDDQSPNRMPRMDSIQHLAADIGPYIGYSPRLFICPSDTTLRPAADISNLTATSYAIVTNAVWQQRPMAPMLLDKCQAHGLAVLTGSNSWSPHSSHKEGGNVLWTDGHVEWMRVLDVGTNRYPLVND